MVQFYRCFNIKTFPNYKWHKHSRQMLVLQKSWAPPPTSHEAKSSHSDKSLKSHQEICQLGASLQVLALEFIILQARQRTIIWRKQGIEKFSQIFFLILKFPLPPPQKKKPNREFCDFYQKFTTTDTTRKGFSPFLIHIYILAWSFPLATSAYSKIRCLQGITAVIQSVVPLV